MTKDFRKQYPSKEIQGQLNLLTKRDDTAVGICLGPEHLWAPPNPPTYSQPLLIWYSTSAYIAHNNEVVTVASIG